MGRSVNAIGPIAQRETNKKYESERDGATHRPVSYIVDTIAEPQNTKELFIVYLYSS